MRIFSEQLRPRAVAVSLVLWLVLVGVVIGFFLGSAGQANVSDPGSAGDPLVARSYVDEKMAASISRLEEKVEKLNKYTLELEQELARLQQQVGIDSREQVPSAGASGSSGVPPGGSENSQQSGSPSARAPDSGLQAPGSPESAGNGSTSRGEKVVYVKDVNAYVNLREGPGTNHGLLGRVVRGDPVCEPMTVLGEEGDWYRVRLPDGREGWVAAWLVTAPH